MGYTININQPQHRNHIIWISVEHMAYFFALPWRLKSKFPVVGAHQGATHSG